MLKKETRTHPPCRSLPTCHLLKPDTPTSLSLPFSKSPSQQKTETLKIMESKSQTHNNATPSENNHRRTNNGDATDGGDELPLMALNHVSRLCRSVKESIEFYTKVLGFVLIERPPAFDFDGAWLFNYGVGIHLVQAKDEERLPHNHDDLDPMDNHISFQCEDMEAVVHKLEELNIKYIKRTVGEEDGAPIDQLFFNDPDGFMIEICNCENLKLVPAGSFGRIKLPFDRHNPPIEVSGNNNNGQVAKAS